MHASPCSRHARRVGSEEHSLAVLMDHNPEAAMSVARWNRRRLLPTGLTCRESSITAVVARTPPAWHTIRPPRQGGGSASPVQYRLGHPARGPRHSWLVVSSTRSPKGLARTEAIDSSAPHRVDPGRPSVAEIPAGKGGDFPAFAKSTSQVERSPPKRVNLYPAVDHGHEEPYNQSDRRGRLSVNSQQPEKQAGGCGCGKPKRHGSHL